MEGVNLCTKNPKGQNEANLVVNWRWIFQSDKNLGVHSYRGPNNLERLRRGIVSNPVQNFNTLIFNGARTIVIPTNGPTYNMIINLYIPPKMTKNDKFYVPPYYGRGCKKSINSVN